ncbi:MAG: hypothetical protein JNJ58_09960 [Chitinophagaceae bacterium]|nr:hypothetical protein [Chitinophagaceae bacterium]
MKQLLLLAVISLFAGACIKKHNANNVTQLPQATQTGANTAGCYINGKLFVTQNDGLWSGNSVKHQRLIFGSDTTITITLSAENPNRTFSMKLKYSLWNRDFDLAEDEPFTGLYMESGSGMSGYTNQDHHLKVHLTNYYPTGLCCGTFSGVLAGSTGEDIVVTEGRFDIAYQP